MCLILVLPEANVEKGRKKIQFLVFDWPVLYYDFFKDCFLILNFVKFVCCLVIIGILKQINFKISFTLNG